MDAHVLIRGRVQGVGFRWFVRDSAQKLGVAGWVKNHADGSVEVAARGDDTAIASLRAALQVGPPGGFVASIEELEPDTNDLPIHFVIRR
ncbi:MAG TPA: acylphosphatase [Gemmatimonadaceae bacterium]|nr:acylphosphatase [Gemmatimonadaceae bacterium]